MNTETFPSLGDVALGLANEALSVFRAFGITHNAANARCNTAAYPVSLRRYDEARAAARDAVAATRDTQLPVTLAFTLQHLAAIGALRPDTNAQKLEDRRGAARILVSDVMFTGDLAGQFVAFEARSGKIVYHDQLSGAIPGGLAAYAVDGKEFAAVVSGYPGPIWHAPKTSDQVVVFSL